MNQLPNGSVQIINLPSSLSLFVRSWGAYKQLFNKLVYLSFLFFIGLLINSSLTSFLTVSVSSGSEGIKTGVAILNTAIGIALTIYASYIIAALVYVIKSHLHGTSVTIQESMKFAQDRFLSLFYVGLVYLFVVYGGIFGIILTTLFSVWYYFCIYVVLVDEERGFAALSKSHYLVRSLFFRTIGRYLAMFFALLACATLIYLSLMIPVIGWLVFILLLVAFFLLAFPFYVVYDFLRFEDISAVDRTVEFIQFKGERAFLIAFAIAGLLLSLWSWGSTILPTEAKKSLQNTINYNFATISLPIVKEMQKNQDVISNFLLKMGIQPAATSIPDFMPSSESFDVPSDGFDQLYNQNY